MRNSGLILAACAVLLYAGRREAAAMQNSAFTEAACLCYNAAMNSGAGEPMARNSFQFGQNSSYLVTKHAPALLAAGTKMGPGAAMPSLPVYVVTKEALYGAFIAYDCYAGASECTMNVPGEGYQGVKSEKGRLSAGSQREGPNPANIEKLNDADSLDFIREDLKQRLESIPATAQKLLAYSGQAEGDLGVKPRGCSVQAEALRSAATLSCS